MLGQRCIERSWDWRYKTSILVLLLRRISTVADNSLSSVACLYRWRTAFVRCTIWSLLSSHRPRSPRFRLPVLTRCTTFWLCPWTRLFLLRLALEPTIVCWLSTFCRSSEVVMILDYILDFLLLLRLHLWCVTTWVFHLECWYWLLLLRSV